MVTVYSRYLVGGKLAEPPPGGKIKRLAATAAFRGGG